MAGNALGVLPYTYTMTSVTDDGNTLTIVIQVKDSNGVSKGDPITVYVPSDSSIPQIEEALKEQVGNQLIADAGSLDAVLQAYVSSGQPLPGA